QTMALAQQLYEGVDLGDGEPVGLITYMRTDSVHVAPEAQAEARTLIAHRWGESYLPDIAPTYRARAGAQEAHEAIRPTSVLREPDAVRQYLSDEQARLYELIWRRFVASQMKPAVYATITVDVTAAKYYLFRANGATLIFPGYLAVYEEGRDDETADKEAALPALTEGELLDLVRLLPEQHHTEPPPRYSEPTLIKALEEHGIGRPSTYASIVAVIQERDYVRKEQGRLRPTALGMVVCDALLATFEDVLDLRYTADMEAQLDQVAEGKLGYVPMLNGFYGGFAPRVERARQAMPAAVQEALWAGLAPELRERKCPQCGKPLAAKLSSAGRLLGCTGYPACRYLLDLGPDGQPRERSTQFAEGETCAKCGGRMQVIERGRDRFLGCENYPKCKYTRPILSERIRQLAAEGTCPACGHAPLEPRKGRFGEYLSCPGCNVNISVRQPRKQQGDGAPTLRVSAPSQSESVDIACPQCGAKPLEKRVGRYGPYYRCPACKKNTSARKLAVATADTAATADEAAAPDAGEQAP
ncbi:MAG: DNA topoisomerase I, partial [Chloroflexi bacterium]|nr:DNA topoisomerase I [Chloroflexota bacterium]